MAPVSNRICILLIEPSFLIREGLKTLLSNQGQPYRIEEFDAPVDDLEKLVNRINPDLVLLNPKLVIRLISLPRFNENIFEPFYIGLIESDTPAHIQSKFDQTLNLDAEKPELNKIMEKSLKQLRNGYSDTENTSLSEREISILKLVALGNTNNEIADKLFISAHTVMTHRKNITRKLGIKTVSGLTVYAILNQLIKLEEVQGV
ncbi:MAG: response regulator transcription factor [Bacteroidales bacterium]|nr:response regulator transcription factor [Bacteroidales bacterium]MDY0085041.1 response regulator transcription factor [Bacteroidales bacterium]